MITIYHLPNSRSLRVVWLMEELGEKYGLEKLSFPIPESFLKVNPLGLIPTIDDDGIILCESIAILQYITGRRLVSGVEAAAALTVGPMPDPAAYAQHLQFLHFGESDLTVPMGAIFRTAMLAGAEAANNATVKDQTAQLTKRLAFLDHHLADGRSCVTGEDFTIADISIGYALHLAQFANLGDLISGNVAAYWERLKARPAFPRATAA